MTEAANRDGRREEVRTLPLNLLLKGRLCLLLGAGHVAHRKCLNLLSHGARVVLVAPDADPRIETLAESGRVEVRAGLYVPGLLDELSPFLVYAATDDDGTNRRIAADSAERGILCSSVSSWREGDFISPSVIPWGRGQVSVTTEGASCRQAKFMRLRLSDLLGGERELLVLGVDLRSLSLDELASVRPSPERVETLTAMLSHLAALEEFALLATCNRFELYAWTRPDEPLLSAALSILGLEAYASRVYRKTGEDVLLHAANVVAGHYSQVACETQITGQWKAAFQRAFGGNVAGVHLQNLHDRVIRLSRKIRSLQGGREDGLPELVADAVRHRLTDAGPNVLLLGAGGLGREIAGRLARIPELRLAWANRSMEKLPETPECPRLPLAEALARLGAFDQVVTVLGAAEPVIRREHLETGAAPRVIFDLGLPRNADADAARDAGVEVLDLGSFRQADVNHDRLLALTETVVKETGLAEIGLAETGVGVARG